MFNVFLPTLLEYRSKSDSKEHNDGDTASSLSGPLWEVVIFTIGGCPGSLVSTCWIANRYHSLRSFADRGVSSRQCITIQTEQVSRSCRCDLYYWRLVSRICPGVRVLCCGTDHGGNVSCLYGMLSAIILPANAERSFQAMWSILYGYVIEVLLFVSNIVFQNDTWTIYNWSTRDGFWYCFGTFESVSTFDIYSCNAYECSGEV